MARQTRSLAGSAAGNEPADARRREIIAAAAELFHQQGFAATSMQDIADAVGILKGSLYHYIRAKHDLLFAVIDAVHADMDANVVRTQGLAGTAQQRIVAFVDGHLHVCMERVTFSQVYAHDLEALDAERRQSILARRAGYERFFRDLLAAGQSTGDVRGDLDVRLLATVTLASLTSVSRWYDPQRSAQADAVAGVYRDVVLGGLLIHPGPSADPTTSRA